MIRNRDRLSRLDDAPQHASTYIYLCCALTDPGRSETSGSDFHGLEGRVGEKNQQTAVEVDNALDNLQNELIQFFSGAPDQQMQQPRPR